MDSFLRRFIDLETDLAGTGDHAGGDPPAADTIYADPSNTGDLGGADPTAITADPQPAYLTADQVEQMIADRLAQADPYQGMPPQQLYPGYDPSWGQQPPAPNLDPLSDEFGPNLGELIRQVVREETMPHLAPITEAYHAQQAQQITDGIFEQMQVPQEWREAVLFASAGFQQPDQYGRMPPPQYALRQGYELLKGFAEAQRNQAMAAAGEQQEQHTQRLRAVTNAPSTPAGAGGVEGPAQPANMREAVRAAAERVTAS